MTKLVRRLYLVVMNGEHGIIRFGLVWFGLVA